MSVLVLVEILIYVAGFIVFFSIASKKEWKNKALYGALAIPTYLIGSSIIGGILDQLIHLFSDSLLYMIGGVVALIIVGITLRKKENGFITQKASTT